MHHDPAYTVGSDPHTMCHTINASEPLKAGYYGDYLCDAPYSLISSAFQFMNITENDPDFIIWTGDDPPHVSVSDLSTEMVLDIINNATNTIINLFPNTQVFPTLGNHDYYPKGQMPPYANDMYYKIGKMWQRWLDDDAFNSFLVGGYYSMLYGNTSLRIVGLNTVYYYTQDTITRSMDDPAGQFEWLENLLLNAQLQNEKVLITGHVPIGVFEREINNTWFYPNFNQRYISIVGSYADVIVGQLFAHQHSDSFRLVKKDEETVGVVLLNPSITPWKTTLKGVSANNPSVRLFNYTLDSNTLDTLTSYMQYYLDLGVANYEGKAVWKFEYSTLSAYNISSLSPSNWENVFNRIECDDDLFQYYCLLNAVSYPVPRCEGDCRIGQLCGISESDYTRYSNCLTIVDDEDYSEL